MSWNDPGVGGTVAVVAEGYLATWWPAIVSPQAGYLAWLTEYGTVGLDGIDGQPGSNQTFAGFGSYTGLYRITPSPANQGSQLDDTAIRAELAAQITAGMLPQPTCDASGRCDTLYMVDLPPAVTTVTLTFGGQTQQLCSSFCGYHMGTTLGGKTFGYAVFPDLTSACPGCAPDGLEQDLGTLHSHEMAEAITDPDLFLENLTPTSTQCMRPGAWDQLASGCGEIGDSCSWPAVVPTVTVRGQSFYVQGLFDNARLDCETSGPTQVCTTSADCAPPTPICDPTGHECRACLPTDCAGGTPRCATTGPNTGSCVVCAADSDCNADLHAPICDATTNTCRSCVPSDCVLLTPACAASGVYAGRCVECASNADCSPEMPVCDPSTYTCNASFDEAGAPGSPCSVPACADAGLDAGAAYEAGNASPEYTEAPGPSATGSGCTLGRAGERARAGWLALLLGAIGLRRRRQGR